MVKLEDFKARLLEIINQDISKAKVRRDANKMEGRDEAVAFDKGVINALAGIKFDMQYLELDLKQSKKNVARYKYLLDKVQMCNEDYNKFYKGDLPNTTLARLDAKLLAWETKLADLTSQLSDNEKDSLNNYYGVIIL